MEELKLISEDEAAKLIGVHDQTLYRWRVERKLAHVRIGKRVLYHPSMIASFIKQHTVEAMSA